MNFKRHIYTSKSSIDFLMEYRSFSEPSGFFKKYNITCDDDGSIYDIDLQKKFTTISDWARYITKKYQYDKHQFANNKR